MPNQPKLDPVTETMIRRHTPHERYEFVTVTFGPAGTDLIIPYTKLRPNDPDDVRWTDVTPTAVWNGATDAIPRIYRSADPARIVWARPYVVLRCTIANHSTRLLLFTERDV